MTQTEPFQDRVKALIERAGGAKPLARRLGVSDMAIKSWLRGSRPFDSTLEQIQERTGVSPRWLRDGLGNEEDELAKLDALPDSTPRAALKAAIERAHLTPAELARRMGYDGGVIENVVNGRGRISEKMIDAIVKALPELGRDELLDGSDTPRVMDQAGIFGTYGAKPLFDLPGGGKTRFVPLISWSAAGSLLNAGALDDAYDHSGVASNVPGQTFAVEVRGDSMHPEINPGDYAVVRADVQPTPGSVVLVRTIHGDVLCKRYQSKQGGKLVVLSSVNRSYEPVEIPANEIAWIYPVKQVIRNY